MKYPLLLLASLLLTGCSSGPSPEASSTPPDQGRGGGREMRRARYEKMFKEMDKDGDGKLSEAEKEAGFEAALQRSDRFRERVDRDGDGKISPEEKSRALKRFMQPRHRDGSPTPAPENSTPQAEEQ